MAYDNMITQEPLLLAIFAKMEAQGYSVAEFCDFIGMSRTYFVSLVNGNKKVVGLSPALLRNIATFLEMPFPEVAIMSGFLDRADMTPLPAGQDLDLMLDHAYRNLATDPKTAGYIQFDIDDWRALPEGLRLLLVDLYLEQTHKHFSERSYEQLTGSKEIVEKGKKSA